MERCLDVKSFGDAQKKDRKTNREKRDKGHRRRERNVDLSSSEINNEFPAPENGVQLLLTVIHLEKKKKDFLLISSLIIMCSKMYYP